MVSGIERGTSVGRGINCGSAVFVAYIDSDVLLRAALPRQS